MRRHEYVVMVVLGFTAGLVGGWMAAHWGGVAHAEQESAVPKVISAGRFEVIDAAGNRRIVIGPDLITIDMDSERVLLGGSGLLFTEVGAEDTLEASVSAKGVSIKESGKVRLDLTMKHGEIGLRLKDREGRLRAALGPVELKSAESSFPTRRPAGSLVLFDGDGAPVWSAPSAAPAP